MDDEKIVNETEIKVNSEVIQNSINDEKGKLLDIRKHLNLYLANKHKIIDESLNIKNENTNFMRNVNIPTQEKSKSQQKDSNITSESSVLKSNIANQSQILSDNKKNYEELFQIRRENLKNMKNYLTNNTEMIAEKFDLTQSQIDNSSKI